MTFMQKVELFRRALWTWRQPLTRRPAAPAVPISDLFVWRNSREWATSFELIDIPGLFSDGETNLDKHVTLCLFDQHGRQFLKKRLELLPGRRQTINLAAFLSEANDEMGTFAVFHSSSPPELEPIGSFLAERGYVSYRYRDSPLRAYVHGNLDAIARGADGELQLLGCSGLLSREYSLQHELQPGVVYELGMVNPTSTVQRCICKLVSVGRGKITGVQVVNLAPGGVQLVPLRADKSEPVRLVIQSHLVMARPLVFRIQNLKLDVFHG
jgi:hypothetical protein